MNMGRTAYTTCDEPGCERAPANGDVLYRVNPKGEKGIFMCDKHAAATWQPGIVRVLDGWSDDHRQQIEDLAKIIEEHDDHDDWEWSLGSAEAIFKAGYRKVVVPAEQPW
jgi:hypothetical protein